LTEQYRCRKFPGAYQKNEPSTTFAGGEDFGYFGQG